MTNAILAVRPDTNQAGISPPKSQYDWQEEFHAKQEQFQEAESRGLPAWVVLGGFEAYVLAARHFAEHRVWPNGKRPRAPSMRGLAIWQCKWLKLQENAEKLAKWKADRRHVRKGRKGDTPARSITPHIDFGPVKLVSEPDPDFTPILDSDRIGIMFEGKPLATGQVVGFVNVVKSHKARSERAPRTQQKHNRRARALEAIQAQQAEIGQQATQAVGSEFAADVVDCGPLAEIRAQRKAERAQRKQDELAAEAGHLPQGTAADLLRVAFMARRKGRVA